MSLLTFILSVSFQDVKGEGGWAVVFLNLIASLAVVGRHIIIVAIGRQARLKLPLSKWTPITNLDLI